jgi:hypothetical protein
MADGSIPTVMQLLLGLNREISPEFARQSRDGRITLVIVDDLTARRGTMPSLADIIRHLQGLKGQPREIAALYVCNAPPQIRTPFRTAIEAELGVLPR